MKNADLHAHTYYSADGEFSPTEVVRKAKAAGLKYIAITDHESVEGVEEALEAGKKLGVEVIPGVEIHAEFGEVIGLFVDHKNRKLIATCNKIRRLIDESHSKTVHLLKRDGFDISVEEIKKRYKTDVVRNPHIAYELIRKGYAESFRDAFDRFLGKGKKYHLEANFPPTLEIIRVIKQAGGLPVLAHPYYENYQEEFRHIKKLVDEGLAGIELFSGSFRPPNYRKVSNEARRLAKKHNLVLTSGSDFHGSAHPKNELGKRNCDEKAVIQLKKRAAKSSEGRHRLRKD